MKKTALLAMVGDDTDHPDPLNRGFNMKAWENMQDPVAIIALTSHTIPSGTLTHAVATKLGAMLPDLTMEQLTAVYRWATIKYRRGLINSCEEHVIAMIENLGDETEEIPDWLITFSSMHCAQDFSEQIRYTALAKINSIVNHVSTQPVLIGDDGLH